MTNYKSNFLFRPLMCVFLFVASFYLFSCSTQKYTASGNFNFKEENISPDYSSLDYWAAHPFKKDPSDNIPEDLKGESTDSIADVFFIHPTTYTKHKMSMGWNAEINNKKLNDKTDNSTILYQASVFNKYCRVFAPRYRQSNLQAFFTKRVDSAQKSFDIAYEDIKVAFEYYLKNYNQGRPIIIASHSQGTLHAARLLKEFFEGRTLQKQLVCAYIIGLPVFKNYFNSLKPCIDSISTGCFVGWRTFQDNYEPPFVVKELRKAYVINPLTWTMDTIFASQKLNKGGILKNFDKVIPEVVHAQIHGNVLWVNKPQFFGSIFLRSKNFHIADYNLFYKNIRENVGTRIKAFLKE
ncbi:MAG: DUF3089 domain-containing protein [Ginsengibacter sp.]